MLMSRLFVMGIVVSAGAAAQADDSLTVPKNVASVLHQRCIDKPFKTIDGKRQFVIGDNNRRVNLTNPFLLPTNTGVRYDANPSERPFDC